jgi:hypothetical protein
MFFINLDKLNNDTYFETMWIHEIKKERKNILGE